MSIIDSNGENALVSDFILKGRIENESRVAVTRLNAKEFHVPQNHHICQNSSKLAKNFVNLCSFAKLTKNFVPPPLAIN